jgi:hypothetical protein
MSIFLERAKKQFLDKLTSSALLSIEVAEWPDENGKPTVIYFKPASTLNVKDFSKFIDLVKQGTVESAVDILILRAIDDKSKAMFKPVERTVFIRETDPVVILSIISRMGEADNEWGDQTGEKNQTLVEIAEKN